MTVNECSFIRVLSRLIGDVYVYFLEKSKLTPSNSFHALTRSWGEFQNVGKTLITIPILQVRKQRTWHSLNARGGGAHATHFVLRFHGPP